MGGDTVTWRLLGLRLAVVGVLALLLARAASAQSPAPPSAAGATEPRVALVIGNAQYEIAPLKNPTNDAQDMAKTLRELGFRVQLHQNISFKKMIEAINAFGQDLKKGGVGLFYFAGHGVQSKGRNYLIPVSLKLGREADLEFDAVDLGRVLGVMDEAGNRVNLVILDACRDNPFAKNFRIPARGLAQIEAAQGSYIAFATGPGSVAQDGAGRNGLYTSFLLRNLKQGDSDIDKVFRRVTAEVARTTEGKQVPWVSSSLTSDFQFRGTPAVADAPPAASSPAPPAAARGAPVDPTEHDRAFWDQVKDSKNPDELNAYLEQYPKGLFAPLARARLKALASTKSPTPPAPAPTPAPAQASARPVSPRPATPIPTGPTVALNVAALPFLSDGGKKRIEKEFVADGKPQKALALTEAGGWGAGNGRGSVDDALAGALDNCQKRNLRHPCFVAAVNDAAFANAGYSPQIVRDAAIELIKRANLEVEFYANEDRDAGIAATMARRQSPMHGATPRTHPVTKTITTRQLVELYKTAKPVPINVLEWTEGAFALPGSVWIQGMGKSSLSRAETTELRLLLAQAVPDIASPLVVYCLSWECWLSYNAALTVSDLGYRNVYWYRGGISAWNQANLPVVRTKLEKQF